MKGSDVIIVLSLLLAMFVALVPLGGASHVDSKFVGANKEYQRSNVAESVRRQVGADWYSISSQSDFTCLHQMLPSGRQGHELYWSGVAYTIYVLENINRSKRIQAAEFMLARASQALTGRVPDWSYGSFQIGLSVAREVIQDEFGTDTPLDDDVVFNYLSDKCYHNLIAGALIREIIEACPDEYLEAIVCISKEYNGDLDNDSGPKYSEAFRMVYNNIAGEQGGGSTVSLWTGLVHAQHVFFPPASSDARWFEGPDYEANSLNEDGKIQRITIQMLTDNFGEVSERLQLAEKRADVLEAKLEEALGGIPTIRKSSRAGSRNELSDGIVGIIQYYGRTLDDLGSHFEEPCFQCPK